MVEPAAAEPPAIGTVSTLDRDERFGQLRGMVGEADGSLLGTSRTQIWRIRDGTVSLVAGGKEGGYVNGALDVARFGSLWGAAWLREGRLLIVAEYYNHCVRQLDLAEGTVSTFAGRGPNDPGPRTLPSPRAVLPLPDGSVACSCGDHTIRLISRAGDISILAGAARPARAVARTTTTATTPTTRKALTVAAGTRPFVYQLLCCWTSGMAG